MTKKTSTPAGKTAVPPKSILLVEDDAAVCYFLERVLRRAGYTVSSAANGTSGLHLFGTRPWDLVITDRAMPGMNGEEMTWEIKHQAPGQTVVLITGMPGRVEHPELFDAIFTKPFSITALLADLSTLLEPHVEGGAIAQK
jgi:DNA-binding response OmpR family regulator